MNGPVVGIIGSPVGHSLTPILQQAAFRELGLSWQSTAFEVGSGGGEAAVEAMKSLGIRGLSVTMPLKEEVAAAADVLSPEAKALDSVNCLSLERGHVIGFSTDGDGLLDALHRSHGLDPHGRSVAILGAGGAARSIAEAFGRRGARSVVVVARRPEEALRCAALAGDAGRPGGPAEGAECDVVVNATPVGMGGTTSQNSPALVAASDLQSRALAVDLVYHPIETPWLLAAKNAGCEIAGGLGMLVHQAALQIERWTDHDAPLEAMWASVENSFGSR
jgi:shikimate dehydrogenase